MWRWEDVKMRRCEDEKMWRWEDEEMRRCEDEKMRRRCEDEKMWRWEDVKMRRCEDEKMWRWEDVLQTPTIGRTLRSDALGKNICPFHFGATSSAHPTHVQVDIIPVNHLDASWSFSPQKSSRTYTAIISQPICSLLLQISTLCPTNWKNRTCQPSSKTIQAGRCLPWFCASWS